MNHSIRRILLLQLFAGLAMLFKGIFLVSLMPYVYLDVVLTPAELADIGRKNATLAIMQHGNNFELACWVIAGIVVSSLSVIGLVALKNDNPASS